MATSGVHLVKTVSASKLREKLKDCMEAASGEDVVRVENRSAEDKYIVDSSYLEKLMKERAEILATLKIMADRDLAARLLGVARMSEDEIIKTRLYSVEEVFGE